MSSEAEARIVLISGANKGIGFGAAAAFARRGHTVLLGSRDMERGDEARRRLAEDGLTVDPVTLDVTEPDTIDALRQHIDQQYGRLDVLVNNAGISRDRPHPPVELPVSALREVYETNVFGVVALTNTMVPLLRRSAAGYVGMVSSGLGTTAFLTDSDSPLWSYAGLLAYNSSKAALNAVTLIYAHVLAEENIAVNALSPGFVATDLNGHRGELSADVAGEHVAEQVLDRDSVTGVFLNENGGTYPW